MAGRTRPIPLAEYGTRIKFKRVGKNKARKGVHLDFATVQREDHRMERFERKLLEN